MKDNNRDERMGQGWVMEVWWMDNGRLMNGWGLDDRWMRDRWWTGEEWIDGSSTYPRYFHHPSINLPSWTFHHGPSFINLPSRIHSSSIDRPSVICPSIINLPLSPFHDPSIIHWSSIHHLSFRHLPFINQCIHHPSIILYSSSLNTQSIHHPSNHQYPVVVL